jgi:predicted xylose isomerase-like sugar epimerase
MQIGIMQGRLLDGPKSCDLDWFPEDDWEREFFIAKSLGFSFIELVIDRGTSSKNPILSKVGRERIKAVTQESGVEGSVCCVNSIIDKSIMHKQKRVEIANIASYCKELSIDQIRKVSLRQ